MKKISSTAAHKLILWICFIPSLFYILLYELMLTKFPSSSDVVFKTGIITSKISYSIIAASIFYFISQYIPVYLPKQRRKIRIIPFVYQQTLIIDYNIGMLESNLGIRKEDFKKNDYFKKTLYNIKVDEPIEEFENWHQFLLHIKTELLGIIRTLYFYNDYLSTEFMHELIIIEKSLMSPVVFAGKKTLEITNLVYAETTLQEILIHNQHLQTLRETESKKYEKKINAAGNEYRQTYYNDSVIKKGSH